MKKTFYRVACGAILLVCFIGLLPVSNVSGAEKKKLYIAYVKKSEFKENVVNALVKMYEKEYAVKVMDYKGLKKVREDEFDALLLVEECRAWLFLNFESKRYIRKTKDKSKIVYFLSTGDPDLELSYKGVDAVTSASEKDRQEETVNEIKEAIDSILKD